jgi:hypothetical protein
LAAASALAQDSVPVLTAPMLALDSRFFELRTYHVKPGKLEALETRFRDHVNKIFAKHGMQVIGFWVPMEKDGAYENLLVYMLAFPNRQARDDDWKAFTADPDWKTVKAESEKDGKLVEKVDSQYLTATEYSPLK